MHILTNYFEISFENLQPTLHEMYVLEHDPMSLFTCIVKCLDSNIFLTLSHGNIKESTLLDRYSTLSPNSLYIGSGVNSREEHEENRCLWVHFCVCSEDIKWSLFYKSFTKILEHKLCECTRQSIGSECS